jgi:hypothetical protein
MIKTTKEPSMEACRFVAEAEEKIITRFIDIAGLKDEYAKATNPNQPLPCIEYAWADLLRKLHKRGYEISEYHDPLAPMDGIDKGMKWRMILLHNGEEVAYSDVEIKIGTMRMTEYGGQI